MSAPTPYYEDDFVTLYHGDSQLMRWPIACENTAVITDPPYGTSLYPTDTDALTVEALRTWTADSPVAVFGWPERLCALAAAAGLVPDEWITWWPTNARSRGFNLQGLWREVECVAVFGNGRWARLTQPAAVTTTPMPNRDKRIKASGRAEVRMGDVWRDESPNLNPNQRGRRHPNEKPESAMRRLVLALSDPGDVIYDPFAGSGTTLVAARQAGRLAVGVELDDHFCEIAAKRLAQTQIVMEVA